MSRLTSTVVCAGVLCILAFALPSSVAAQTDEEVTQAQSDISGYAEVEGLFDADASVFKHDQFLALLQINAMVNRASLTTIDSDKEGVEAVYEIMFQVCQQRKVLAKDYWKRVDWSPSEEKRVANLQIPEIARYGVPPGDFELIVRVVDLNGQCYQEKKFNKSTGYFSETQVELSDVMFASEVDPRGVGDEFALHDVTVIPRVSTTYGEGQDELRWFVEAYNVTPRKQEYLRIVELSDSTGTTVFEPDVKYFKSRKNDTPLWGTVDLTDIPSGDYTLTLTLVDPVTDFQTSSRKQLAIERFKYEADLALIEKTGLSPKETSDEDLLVEFQVLQYFLPVRYRRIAQSVNDLDQIRVLLSQFYAQLDPDTTTPENEFRETMLSRIQLANDRFGVVRTHPGWKRDRGRVLILYGEPDLIDRYEMAPANAHAYEIWDYEKIEGGVHFVFVDRSDIGLYSLVHSTKRDELSNPDWKARELLVASESNSTSHFEATGQTGIGR